MTATLRATPVRIEEVWVNGVADGTRTHDNRNHKRKKGVVAFRKRLNKKKAG
jgi:hypothetical protein